jgi:predicted SAM-dependent methyltransferase
MGLKNAIYRFSEKVYLDKMLANAFFGFRQSIRGILGVDSKILNQYLVLTESPKLHIGCGYHLLGGWLNTDLYPGNNLIHHLDATKAFPFGEETFTHIFSEHMIEHIPYISGVDMLKECYRVLKTGGKIRLVTPDLDFLINLYNDPENNLNRQYRRWANESFWEIDLPDNNAGYVINNFVRAWGHQFIYDKSTISNALKTAGFKNIVFGEIGKSENEAFKNLENTTRMPAGFLELESLVVEAEK